MDHAAAFRGLECVECGEAVPTDAADRSQCDSCGGSLEPRFDLAAVDAESIRAAPRAASMWAFDDLLPFAAGTAVSMGEGGTPLVACPSLADELGVERVLVKDEGHNPTGTTADRQLAVAVTAALERGAADVALPSTGTDAVSAAAYAARAGLESHCFVPTRSAHGAKAMINVHGGDMTVVEGRLPDAEGAYESASEGEDWAPLAPAGAPLRVAGAATVLLEVAAELDWTAPDAVVYPTGHGVGIAGAHVASRQLTALGILEVAPRLYAAQAAGCAPVVRAVEEGTVSVPAGTRPDTICGALEVPDPAYGERALDAVAGTGGDAVTVDDRAILESATTVAAAEGLQSSVAGGAAAAGAWELAEAGAFDADDTVVLVDPMAGSLDADVLRSHLMRAGV